jgi:hypothetical protein
MNTKFINPNNPLRANPAPQKKVASRKDERVFDETQTFNPKRYAGETATGQVKVANDRMFDSRGELQAHDTRDALHQMAHLYNEQASLINKKASFAKQASAQDQEKLRKVIAYAASDLTGEGRALLGQELNLPIKAMIDFEGISRKIFRERMLNTGEFYRVPKDIRATAYTVGQGGQGIATSLNTDWIVPEEVEINSFPMVDLSDLYLINFDVLERLQETARQEIQLQEDRLAMNLITQAAAYPNQVANFGQVSLAVFSNLQYQVERHRLAVDKFLINRQELNDIKSIVSGAVDMVTQREIILAGYMGNVYGAKIFVAAGIGAEEVIQAGNMYAVTAPEYLGEMVIRTELFSEPVNGLATQSFKKGFAFYEKIGFVLPNTRSCALAQRM